MPAKANTLVFGTHSERRFIPKLRIKKPNKNRLLNAYRQAAKLNGLLIAAEILFGWFFITQTLKHKIN